MAEQNQGFDYRELDELIHSKPRLGLMSILATAEQVEFTFLRGKLELTDGNLATHLKRLEEAGYIKSKKSFVERKPQTTYGITAKGRRAFELYVSQIEKLIDDTK
jgi:DNA-binding MarR family transcriptional regulator